MYTKTVEMYSASAYEIKNIDCALKYSIVKPTGYNACMYIVHSFY